jgi:enterochelin esterase-like enzyme
MTESALPPTSPGELPRQRPTAPTLSRVYDSHQVHSDRSITFRLDAPNAQRVELVTDITSDVLPFTKAQDGLWSVTTATLSPAIYAYAFSVDGVDQPDPRNPWLKRNLISNASMVLVPGAPAEPWETTAVPHGIVHSHLYTTLAVEGLVASQSRYLVYTPPGYDAHANPPYPVLYLLHGWSDTEASWTQVGQAHFIVDALIASGKAQPMIVVMPLSYGQMSFVETNAGVWNDSAAILANVTRFQQALLSEVLPQVESSYNVRRNRNGRAIAGQSMGGLESLLIGLNNADRFAWIGSFSAAVSLFDAQQAPRLLPNLNLDAAKPKLVWLSCGTEDPLLPQNRAVATWLKQQLLPITEVETPGGHTWPVWRNNLILLAPLLFENRHQHAL